MAVIAQACRAPSSEESRKRLRLLWRALKEHYGADSINLDKVRFGDVLDQCSDIAEQYHDTERIFCACHQLLARYINEARPHTDEHSTIVELIHAHWPELA